LNAKDTYPDVVEALRASMALPGFTHGNVSIGGRRYLDGAVALPLPARLLMRYQPTDVLFLANRSKASTDSRLNKIASRLMTSSYSKRIQTLFMSRNARLAKELKYLRESSCRIAIVWSDGEVGAYERDKQKLTAAVERAHTHLYNLFMRAGSS
jgi:predicted acylesterase/phospholipase RssA